MPADFRVTALQIMWLITHKRDFLMDFADRLSPDFFPNAAEKYLVKWALDHYEEHDEVISEAGIEQLIEDNEEELDTAGVEEDDLWRLYSHLKSVRKSERKYLANQTDLFCRHQTLGLALRQASTVLKEDGPDDAWQVIEAARGSNTREEDIVGISLLDDAQKVLKRIGDRETSVEHISTGIPKLDMLMDGGLLPGEVACFIAPTGKGKTMYLSHTAAMALLMGSETVYYTLEVDEDEIWLRIMAAASGARINDLRSYAAAGADPEYSHMRHSDDSPEEKIKRLHLRLRRMGGLENKILIRDVRKRGASLDTIVADFTRLKAQGHAPRVMIIDYADRLRPSGRYERRYEGQQEVYQELQALAKELNIAIWTASQAGRAGLHTAELHLDFVEGAFAKAFECTYVLAAGQDKMMALRDSEEFMFLMAKARRSGSSGMKFFVRYDLSRSRFRATQRKRREDEEEIGDDYAEANAYERDEDPEEDEEAANGKQRYRRPRANV